MPDTMTKNMQLNVSKNQIGLKGEITIPADKSISHRAIILAALPRGESLIENFSQGADCASTLSVLNSLGIVSEFKDEKTLLINSQRGFQKPTVDLYCGNSGTTMRMMSGLLAGQRFSSVLTGDESLSKRPMKRIITPLWKMGAKISSNGNKAPLRIEGKSLDGIEFESNLASAQVKSCVLLGGLHAMGKTHYIEPYMSRNHTEKMLEHLGASISVKGTVTTIERSIMTPKKIQVVGDISSAAFFIVAALIVPGSDIIIKDVGLNPTRTGILDVVEAMGGNIEILDKRLVSNEEVGDIRVRYSELKACTIEGEIIPRLIDEIPVIAVLATQAEGTTIVKDAQDLRNKESDRINTIVTELSKIGADIAETEDGFIVGGLYGCKTALKGDMILDTYQDHRLAMSLYVAGLICERAVLINDFEWTNISFPEFEELMNGLTKD